MNGKLRIGTFALVMVPALVGAAACSAQSVPTKFTPINESLEMLLNEGWKIVSGDLKGMILQNAGKWVSCEIIIFREGIGITKAISKCAALN